MKLDRLLTELETFGAENDSANTERPKRMLNITRDTGQLLDVLVKANAARRVLEIGTSNGYSTLWLARAAKSLGGKVVTIELSDYKIALAKANFDRSGLSDAIEQLQADAGKVLADTPDAAFDFIFLDSERSEYVGWWPDIKRVLRPGGLLVVDNATLHQSEMAPFVGLVDGDAAFSSSRVPVGNGEYLAVKAR
ncbi:O-methyltransferase [Andreprevotia chitinilytica]|uniref:O-methyltransferase n=1 Tax=Andreprevotia chitinilytica TaxID=396808 RepID=UPI000556429B|nr:class I SAM-dependent methyltransferase [Andreprevotia chitinilytica]